MATITKARRCEGVTAWGGQCGNQLPPQDGPGRARRFCSDTCRSAKRRQREYIAMTHLPHCYECPKRATSYALLDTMRRVELCEVHAARIDDQARTFGVKVVELNEYDVEGLKRAELLREEKARLGIELRGQVTVDDVLDDLVDELGEEAVEELVELDELVDHSDRIRQRQELVGNTGNVPQVLKGNRCKQRHHDDCDGTRTAPTGWLLCLCTCHDEEA